MLDAYLNQRVELKRYAGTNDFGEALYGDAEVIPCRYQPRAQNVLTSTGQIVKTQHIYYTTQAVAEGDRLDGKVVMAVSEWIGLTGDTMGYKAVM